MIHLMFTTLQADCSFYNEDCVKVQTTKHPSLYHKNCSVKSWFKSQSFASECKKLIYFQISGSYCFTEWTHIWRNCNNVTCHFHNLKSWSTAKWELKKMFPTLWNLFILFQITHAPVHVCSIRNYVREFLYFNS